MVINRATIDARDGAPYEIRDRHDCVSAQM
jgi:hypothetical protein